MSALLERIKMLLGECNAFPDNMSRTEVTHYAIQVLELLKCGNNPEPLELYLRRISTTGLRHPHASAAIHELAEQAVLLFNNSKMAERNGWAAAPLGAPASTETERADAIRSRWESPDSAQRGFPNQDRHSMLRMRQIITIESERKAGRMTAYVAGGILISMVALYALAI